MKRIKIVSFTLLSLFALGCILFLPKTKADVIKSKYFNYVEKGAKVIKTSPSTQYKLMETYPQATVTVYNVGTTDLATIWADRDGLIIKANPFTADTDSFYYFYVDCGKYDIKFSGIGVAVPYTYGDVFICGEISSGGGTNNFFVGTAGTDFNVNVVGDDVTYNLPSASLINRGAVTINAQQFAGKKTFTPTTTFSGFNFGTLAGDPSTVVAGDCWFNTISNTFRCSNGSNTFFLGQLNFIDDTFIDFTQTNNNITATVTDALKIVSYTLFFSASGDTLDTTDGPLVIVPDFAGEIVGWTVYEKGNISGSVSFSVDKVTPTYPVTVAPTFSTMVGVGNKPALSTQIANRANVSSWTTTTFAQGDIIRISIDSTPTDVVNVFVEFKVRRTGL